MEGRGAGQKRDAQEEGMGHTRTLRRTSRIIPERNDLPSADYRNSSKGRLIQSLRDPYQRGKEGPEGGDDTELHLHRKKTRSGFSLGEKADLFWSKKKNEKILRRNKTKGTHNGRTSIKT